VGNAHPTAFYSSLGMRLYQKLQLRFFPEDVVFPIQSRAFVAITGTRSDSCKAEALPYVHERIICGKFFVVSLPYRNR